MNAFLTAIFRLSWMANIIAGVALTLMMLVTVSDVFLRSLGRPIVGIFELVAFCGAVVIGFSVPYTSWGRGHIFVDFFVLKLPPTARKVIHTMTRGLGLTLFFLVGWNLFAMGKDLARSGEVSPTLQLPFYPIVFGLGVCCFLQSLVLLGDIVKVFRGRYE
jgi:TRAP-type C4-dicarboxylate transport system permease small subunit